MTANEIKLIDLIRQHTDIEQAIAIATKIIEEYLAQSQPSEATSPAYSREQP